MTSEAGGLDHTERDLSYLAGLQDLPREHGFESLRVEGTLPHDLRGTLYRNGPGVFGVNGVRYGHWFDGDGAISAVRMADGRAFGASRVIQTRGLERQRQAGRRLFGSWGTPLARPFAEIVLRDRKNPVNTSVMMVDGRLLALCEGGLPYEVSTYDLSTLGESNLHGVVEHAFSAHPHRSPAHRAMYNFGLHTSPKRTEIEVHEIADTRPNGTELTPTRNTKRLTRFEIDGMRMNHDFAVTDRHLLFVFSPFFANPMKLLRKQEGFVGSGTWRPELGSEIVVIPIDDPTQIRRFFVPTFHLEHLANAWEEDGVLLFDFVGYDTLQGLEGFVGGLIRGEVSGPLDSSLRRGKLSLARNELTIETLLTHPFELPKVSPAVEGARYRHVYLAALADKSSRQHFDSVMKIDVSTGLQQTYSPGIGKYTSEPIFAEKSDARTEDDGFLLTMVYDAKVDTSCLEVLDARDITLGPIARCHFDHRIPLGFHGIFVP